MTLPFPMVDGIGREHSSWDLVGLEKWTEYRVWVRAHTDVGPGPESSPVLVRTDEDESNLDVHQ